MQLFTICATCAQSPAKLPPPPLAVSESLFQKHDVTLIARRTKIKTNSPTGDSREHSVKQGYVRGISRDERADVCQENARGDGLEVHRLAVRERGQ